MDGVIYSSWDPLAMVKEAKNWRYNSDKENRRIFTPQEKNIVQKKVLKRHAIAEGSTSSASSSRTK